MKATHIEALQLASGEEIAVYRAPCGGVFGVDASYLQQVSTECTDSVFEPFNGQAVLLDK